MIKFGAALRRIFLTITLTVLLFICVLHINEKEPIGAVIYLIAIGACAIFLLVSVISVIVRLIRRARMDEREAMMDSYTGFLTYLPNSNILMYFRQLGFWGTIMLIVNIFAFDTKAEMFIGGPYSTDKFLAGYHGFLLWGLITLIISFILSILFWAVFMPHYGEGTYNIFQYIGKLFVADITSPYTILKNAFSKESKKKGWVRLVTMIVFIAVNVIGVLKSI